MLGLTYHELMILRPCTERRIKVTEILGNATTWNGRRVSAAEAVAKGVPFNDLIWVASTIALSDKDVERRLRLWLSDCSARVLIHYETRYPNDSRVRDAIVATRDFARGNITSAARSATESATESAARSATESATESAARFAARSAARSAAWSAARSATESAARFAARSAAWSATESATESAAWSAAESATESAARFAARSAARFAEEKWQFERLVLWLSDPEPSDWPLPTRQGV